MSGQNDKYQKNLRISQEEKSGNHFSVKAVRFGGFFKEIILKIVDSFCIINSRNTAFRRANLLQGRALVNLHG